MRIFGSIEIYEYGRIYGKPPLKATGRSCHLVGIHVLSQ